jgi:hypothetical protein
LTAAGKMNLSVDLQLAADISKVKVKSQVGQTATRPMDISVVCLVMELLKIPF